MALSNEVSGFRSTALDSMQSAVLTALLGMQRKSWEQGVASHAALDLGLHDLAAVMAQDAVTLQLPDGRLAEVDGVGLVNSGAVGEVVAWAAARDVTSADAAGFAAALERQLEWLRHDCPRTQAGTLMHIVDLPELWIDTVYMVCPLFVLAGDHDAALAQFRGHFDRLFDVDAGLYGWRCDEALERVIHPEHWGTGTGWVLAAIARAVHLGLRDDWLVEHARTVIDAVLELRTADGSFHNILDDPETFEENAVGVMTAYAVLTGVADGWLPHSYAVHGHSLVQHARTLIDDHGFVRRVCGAPHFDHQGTSAEAQSFFLLATAAQQRLGDHSAE